ncbi:hypothetical protein ABR32_01545 [Enterobacter cloacae subsp. dissolvens]|nr:hypothetical protein ABR32_01545 [Enterobacter cloacae subsp. dissolvens]
MRGLYAEVVRTGLMPSPCPSQTLKTATHVAVLLLPRPSADFPLPHYAALLPLPAPAAASRTL